MDEASRARSKLASGAVLVLVLASPALLVWRWSEPIAAAPLEMPPLYLEPSAVASQIAADRAAAERAPRDEERAHLYREYNAAEHAGVEPAGRARARDEALRAEVASLIEAHAEAGLWAARARDVAALEPAIRGELSRERRVAVLGGFVRMMQRYGLVQEGRQVAPRLVVRTLFKARWNAIHGRELTEALSPIELRAYWGWLALRGESAPLERRLEALERYRRAGGVRHREARAVLLYDDGLLEEAREAFEAAYAATPTFRLRNHALACEGSFAPAPP